MTNIRYETNQPLALIVIDRERDLNTLDIATINELTEAFNLAERDTDVRAVILTGSGIKAFVAGADVSELAALSPEAAKQYAERGQELTRKIEQLGKPVLAAINGD